MTHGHEGKLVCKHAHNVVGTTISFLRQADSCSSAGQQRSIVGAGGYELVTLVPLAQPLLQVLQLPAQLPARQTARLTDQRPAAATVQLHAQVLAPQKVWKTPDLQAHTPPTHSRCWKEPAVRTDGMP